MRARLAGAQHRAADLLGSHASASCANLSEVLDRALRMFASTRSLDAIVERAHRILIEAIYAPVSRRLLKAIVGIERSAVEPGRRCGWRSGGNHRRQPEG